MTGHEEFIFKRGRLTGAIETYQGWIEELSKQPKKSYAKISYLITTFASAKLILEQELSTLKVDQPGVFNPLEETGDPNVP